MTTKIEIVVNDLREMVPENISISDLISHFKEDDLHLVVELNGRFVYPQEYPVTFVSEGDIIEFINPDFGG